MPGRLKYTASKTTFEVEGVRFTVDRRLLEESVVFQDMFSLPVGDGEGASFSKPIHLEGIRVDNFCTFLDVLNARDEEDMPLSVEELKGVLRLAHMWEFKRVMALAVKNLDDMLDDASKVQLSLKYDIKPWYYPALRRLAERREDLTAYEVEQLGWDIAYGIQGIREILSIRSLEDMERSAGGYAQEFTVACRN